MKKESYPGIDPNKNSESVIAFETANIKRVLKCDFSLHSVGALSQSINGISQAILQKNPHLGSYDYYKELAKQSPERVSDDLQKNVLREAKNGNKEAEDVLIFLNIKSILSVINNHLAKNPEEKPSKERLDEIVETAVDVFWQKVCLSETHVHLSQYTNTQAKASLRTNGEKTLENEWEIPGAELALPDAYEIVLREEVSKAIEEAIGASNLREAKVIRQIFYENKTQADNELGADNKPLTGSRIGQIKKVALERLSKMLELATKEDTGGYMRFPPQDPPLIKPVETTDKTPSKTFPMEIFEQLGFGHVRCSEIKRICEKALNGFDPNDKDLFLLIQVSNAIFKKSPKIVKLSPAEEKMLIRIESGYFKFKKEVYSDQELTQHLIPLMGLINKTIKAIIKP